MNKQGRYKKKDLKFEGVGAALSVAFEMLVEERNRIRSVYKTAKKLEACGLDLSVD